MVDIPLVALGVQPMKDPFGTYAKSYAQGIELDNKIATQDAQRRFQEGDQSALRDMMIRDPDNAYKLGMGMTALQSYEDQQFQREYSMAAGTLSVLSRAEKTQKPILWDSYLAMAQQQGMQIPPQLQGGYTPEKEQFLSQQLEMSKMRMMGGGMKDNLGKGVQAEAVRMSMQKHMAEGDDYGTAKSKAIQENLTRSRTYYNPNTGITQAEYGGMAGLETAPQPILSTPQPTGSVTGASRNPAYQSNQQKQDFGFVPMPQKPALGSPLPIDGAAPAVDVAAPAQGFNNIIGAPGSEAPPLPPTLQTVPNAPEVAANNTEAEYNSLQQQISDLNQKEIAAQSLPVKEQTIELGKLKRQKDGLQAKFEKVEKRYNNLNDQAQKYSEIADKKGLGELTDSVVNLRELVDAYPEGADIPATGLDGALPEWAQSQNGVDLEQRKQTVGRALVKAVTGAAMTLGEAQGIGRSVGIDLSQGQDGSIGFKVMQMQDSRALRSGVNTIGVRLGGILKNNQAAIPPEALEMYKKRGGNAVLDTIAVPLNDDTKLIKDRYYQDSSGAIKQFNGSKFVDVK